MFTRKDYMEGRCSHSDYYAQFVDAPTRERVARAIGVDKIRASADPHFNDIPLACWGVALAPVPAAVAAAMRAAGDYPTLAGAVCVAKEAARQIKAVVS